MADNQPRYDSKQIRSIRELFKGRFTDNDIRTVFEENGKNSHRTVTYLLETDPQQVRADIQEKLNRIPEHVRIHAEKRQHETEGDLYACQACDTFWWRLSPKRKRVSKCNLCFRRYDMVDPAKWWGWAEFNCDCGSRFHGWCHMEVTSPCRRCQTWILPTRILPPRRDRKKNRRRRIFHRGPWHLDHDRQNLPPDHICAHCVPMQHNMGNGNPHFPGPNKCAYVPYRQANNLSQVIDPSQSHDSTGSTVDTFLPQGDLRARYKDFDDMETIAERSSGSDSDS